MKFAAKHKMYVWSEARKIELKREREKIICVLHPMRYLFLCNLLPFYGKRKKTHLKGLKAAKNIRLVIKN